MAETAGPISRRPSLIDIWCYKEPGNEFCMFFVKLHVGEIWATANNYFYIYFQATSPVAPIQSASRSQTKSEKRSGNTLYQELAFHDIDASMVDGDDGADITGTILVRYFILNILLHFVV